MSSEFFSLNKIKITSSFCGKKLLIKTKPEEFDDDHVIETSENDYNVLERKKCSLVSSVVVFYNASSTYADRLKQTKG